MESEKNTSSKETERWSGTLKQWEVAQYLREIHDLSISEETLVELSMSGRGPQHWNSLWGPAYETEDVAKWAEYHFRLRYSADSSHSPAAVPQEKTGPRWLHVGDDGPDAEYVARQFEAWGCCVEGPHIEAEPALRAAAKLKLNAAYIAMDWSTEAAIAVCVTLKERRVPFIVQSNLLDMPRPFRFASAHVKASFSMEDLADTIRYRLPSDLQGRMDLSKLIPYDEDVDWYRRPDHPAMSHCYYNKKGVCRCDPWHPQCEQEYEKKKAVGAKREAPLAAENQQTES